MASDTKPTLSLVPASRKPRDRGPAPNFDDRADNSFIRAGDLVRNPNHPNRCTVLDISLSTLSRYVNAGTFPKPHKFTPGLSAWLVSDVRAWIDARHTEAMALAA